ncbi:MAG: dienelactone hydrolase family protein [Ilumatobacteraceae bacterium]
MTETGVRALAGWTTAPFTAAGMTHDVLRRGTGPGVVIVHEIPGITPNVANFANEVVDAGFTVVMPSLVGTPGRVRSAPYVLTSMAKICISREFTVWALNETSPIIAFLRAVARSLHNDVGGSGVGAIGMCFSGGFALGMMVDEIMVAPVLSQPSLPFASGKSERGADLNLSPDDALTIAERAAQGCQVLGLRFTEDKLVGTRFDSLRTLLGDRFIAVEVPSQHAKDHSVLTEERDDPSVARVIQFLRDKLQAPPAQ